MYSHRAKEISESALLAKVLYNGVPVFIQHVDEKSETAQIYPLDDPSQEETVPLSSLEEK